MAPRVAIIGGSLGGLTAALTLRDAGCDVTVYERSPAPLSSQGAGIVLHPTTARYLRAQGRSLASLSITARTVCYMDDEGSIVHERPSAYHFSSYNAIYSGLLACLEPARYMLGAAVAGFSADDAGVTISLADGDTARYDLLVCADGVRSTGRRILLPDLAPSYVGYVAWRGTVDQSEVDPETFAMLGAAITYHLLPDGHLLVYPIPVAGHLPGSLRRSLNWLWYWNVAPGPDLDDLLTDRAGARRDLSVPVGAVQERHIAGLRAAAGRLPPPLARLIQTTRQPFLQAIVDLAVPRMAFGRACLIGDAAFVIRPHVAAGTAKAAADAWALSRAVRDTGGDLPAALLRWEPEQLALGSAVLARARAAGRRLQIEQSWAVGEPLPFGLFAPGDSVMAD